MGEEGATKTLNLTATFTDPDGDVLTLDVVENDMPSVVKATVQGTTLTLNFQKSGAARITIRASDSRGGTEVTSFTVTVQALPRPMLQDRQDMIGVPIQPLQLTATDCTPCTFTVSNLPPDLTFDQQTGVISGNIAFIAFTRGDDGNPQYQVSVTASTATTSPSSTGTRSGNPRHQATVKASDATTGLASTGTFIWRIVQGEVVADAGPPVEESGGDPAGESGDGAAGGEAGDGGDESPLAGAKCKFVDLGTDIEQVQNEKKPFTLR